MEHRAELFVALADANHEYWMERGDVKLYVQALILFRARQVTPVLFAAWERFSPDDFVRVLKLVTVVSFRYVVSGRNPNALEPACHEAARAILDGIARRPAACSPTFAPSTWTTERSRTASRVLAQSESEQEARQVHTLPAGGTGGWRFTRSRDRARDDKTHRAAKPFRGLVRLVHRVGGRRGEVSRAIETPNRKILPQYIMPKSPCIVRIFGNDSSRIRT